MADRSGSQPDGPTEPAVTRRAVLRSTGTVAVAGAVGPGTGAVRADTRGPRSVQLHVWPHERFVDRVADTPAWADWLARMDAVCDIFESYFESMATIESATATNRLETAEPRSVETNGNPRERDVRAAVPAETRTEGAYNLVVVSDPRARLGSNRGAWDDAGGAVGWVNATVPTDSMRIETPPDYRDAMALHEIFHAFTGRPGCPDDHELGDPDPSVLTASNPSIMAAGYAFALSRGTEGCTPKTRCGGDPWVTSPRRPSPALRLTACTNGAITETVDGEPTREPRTWDRADWDLE
ncbi:hypothetical protein [Halopiger djelfimassiliensis]|uniref:hypothetical protein n=1 Tax=Halopiger djelfimassiliensis TaxID=1293047 RepID=UPI0006779212|nr:hypothetical protein [Halopiger djelfimassiliensis]